MTSPIGSGVGYLGDVMGAVFYDSAKATVREKVNTTYNACDRRKDEVYTEVMMGILQSSPPIDASPASHSKYRRQANEALEWAKKNLTTDEYGFYRDQFNTYLQESVDQGDGNWSNGRYTHHYSNGSRDFNVAETAGRAVLKGLHGLTGLLSDPDGKRHDYCVKTMRDLDSYHESGYRHRHGIPHTPPESPREL